MKATEDLRNYASPPSSGLRFLRGLKFCLHCGQLWCWIVHPVSWTAASPM